MFILIVEWASGWYWYDAITNPEGLHKTDALGVPAVPLTLLVLGCLRILGRSICLDGIQELSGISPGKIGTFFHLFVYKVFILICLTNNFFYFKPLKI